MNSAIVNDHPDHLIATYNKDGLKIEAYHEQLIFHKNGLKLEIPLELLNDFYTQLSTAPGVTVQQTIISIGDDNVR